MGIEPIVELRQRIETLLDISRAESKTVQNESLNFLVRVNDVIAVGCLRAL